jgi:hypothetical protein
MIVYCIGKYLKCLDGSAGMFVTIRKTAYFDKEKAVIRAGELNDKSYNYVYKVHSLEVM